MDTNSSYDFSLTQEGLRVVDTNDLAAIARRELSGSAFVAGDINICSGDINNSVQWNGRAL